MEITKLDEGSFIGNLEGEPYRCLDRLKCALWFLLGIVQVLVTGKVNLEGVRIFDLDKEDGG